MLKKILNWLLGREEEHSELLNELKQAEEQEVEKEFLELVEQKPAAPKKRAKKPAAKKRARKPAKAAKTTKKDEVLKLLSRRKKPAKLEDIAEKVGVTTQTARRYLYYLKKEGKVDKKGDGWVKK